MRRYARAAGLALGSFLFIEQARAESPPPVARSRDATRANVDEVVAKERPTTKSFYGWKILATGEVGAVLVSLSVLLPDKPLDSLASTGGFVIGMPAYMIGGPIVHWTHGDFGKGLISFGGNAAFALVGGVTGQSIRCSNDGDPDCGMKGFLTGVAVGALVAPIVDAIVPRVGVRSARRLHHDREGTDTAKRRRETELVAIPDVGRRAPRKRRARPRRSLLTSNSPCAGCD